jgi:hypothetical protein
MEGSNTAAPTEAVSMDQASDKIMITGDNIHSTGDGMNDDVSQRALPLLT